MIHGNCLLAHEVVLNFLAVARPGRSNLLTLFPRVRNDEQINSLSMKLAIISNKYQQ
jgi:hypothetical protein